jgi:hypothetical protein
MRCVLNNALKWLNFFKATKLWEQHICLLIAALWSEGRAMGINIGNLMNGRFASIQ